MVYLAKLKGENKCKIGYSANPNSRISNMQTGSPSLVYLLSVMDGDKEFEKSLHFKFKDYRIKGEWFIYSDEIKNYFCVEEKYVFHTPMVKFMMDSPEISRRIFASLIENQIESYFKYTKELRESIAKSIDCKVRTLEKKEHFDFLVRYRLVLHKGGDYYGINPAFVEKVYGINAEEEIAFRKELASIGVSRDFKNLN